jgi:serine/threonine-protein kinase
MAPGFDSLKVALADRYAIESEIGEGGMATVYLARDLKHNRSVAVKVLRPELAAVLGGERFLTEIQTTANLQHPHILPLFDSGETDGFLFYVMPFVEGESLGELLDREKQLPVEEAVRIAKAVASALDYAHRHDVIHRDIKPENILLHDGEPVVADFGIALAVSAAGGGRLTETGLSLGTPHYMSPEQATADRSLTARSDVYSLGCVLYEMLTGDPPHTGPTAQAILMRILTEQPRPVTDVRRSVPAHIAGAVARAIEKLPADRFESASELAQKLDDTTFRYATLASGAPSELHDGPVAVAPAGTSARSWLRDVRSVAVLATLAVTLIAVALFAVRQASEPAPVNDRVITRFGFGLGDLTPPTDIAISPDGSLIVFAASEVGEGSSRLYLRRAEELTIQPIPNTEGASHPFFSPDGRWIGFVANLQELRRIPTEGGRSLLITSQTPFIRDPDWGAEGSIVFWGFSGLYTVPFTGGDADQIYESGPLAARYPHLLPGSRAVLFTQSSVADTDGEIRALDLGSGEVTSVLPGGASPQYVEPGYLLFGTGEQALFAAPFDLERLEVVGPSTPALDQVTVDLSNDGGGTHFALSAAGTAVFTSAPALTNAARLVVLSLDGTEIPIPLPPDEYGAPRFSPDGRKISFEVKGEVWIYDLITGSRDLIATGDASMNALWSNSGSLIAFTRVTDGGRNHIAIRPTDLSAPARDLTVLSGGFSAAWAWTPDDSRLVLQTGTPTTRSDISVLDVESPAEVVPYLRSEWIENAPNLSPNGRWVAYESNEEGPNEVYVRAFPEPGARHKVSLSGGIGARWSRDGRSIMYRDGDTVMLAEVRTDTTFEVISRRALFVGPYRGHDLHPEGDRLLAYRVAQENEATQTGTDGSARVFVVVNWLEELRARLSPTSGSPP